MAIPATFCRESRVSGKVETEWGFCKYGAASTGGSTLLAERCNSAKCKSFGKVGFPAKAVGERPPLVDFPRIRDVSCHVPLPHVIGIRRGLRKGAGPAQQKIR